MSAIQQAPQTSSSSQPPPGDPVTQSVGRLTWEYGVLGIICVLLIAALVWVVKRWQQAMQDKVDITKTYADSLKDQNDAATALIVETNRHNDALKVGFEGLKTEVTSRRGDFGKVEDAVEDLQREQREFIVAARAAGKING